MTSISSMIGAAGYSWSASGKDRNGDGSVTRDEFKLPVMEGHGSIVPADLRAGGSLDDMFNAYDRNRDGRIDQVELSSGALARGAPADRFRPDWANGMAANQAAAYFKTIDDENAALIALWGLKSAS